VRRWLERHGYTFDAPRHGEGEFPEQAAQTALWRGKLATVDEQGRVTPLERKPQRGGETKTKGEAEGFELHADVVVAATDREGRERLCRYILRPPFVLERLSRTSDGRVAYERKYQSRGATHIVMAPVEFLARLSALIFPPRHPILRYHGVFSAHHRLRARIAVGSPAPAGVATVAKTPRTRPKKSKSPLAQTERGKPAPLALPTGGYLAAANRSLDWQTLLLRTYSIDALACPCGGRLRFIAVVTHPLAIRSILTAMQLDPSTPPRAPPRQRSFDGV
jgi:hypothetical protein